MASKKTPVTVTRWDDSVRVLNVGSRFKISQDHDFETYRPNPPQISMWSDGGMVTPYARMVLAQFVDAIEVAEILERGSVPWGWPKRGAKIIRIPGWTLKIER